MIACPNCGGNLKFSVSHQQLACEYCNSLFDPYAFDSKTSDAVEEKDFEVTVFTCPQCGGEILSTDDTAAGFCSFCGASTILYSRISNEHRPNYIIPFSVSKDDCKQAYGDLMKKAIFAPKEMKNPDLIDSFRGIYMPYWAYYVSQGGHVSVPAKRESRHGDYIITDHYDIEGDLNASYKGLSYDASSSFADNISQALAPYDVKNMKRFTPAFLSGFYADTADVPAEIYGEDAKKIAHDNTINKIQGYYPDLMMDTNRITPQMLNTNIEAADYSMFPVWFMSYRNGDRVAYATVNGQTGKVVSDLPVDIKKYLLGSLALAVPIFILLCLMATITPHIMVLIAICICIVTLIIYFYGLYRIHRIESNADDKGKQFSTSKAANTASSSSVNAPAAKKPVLGPVLLFVGLAIALIVFALNPYQDWVDYSSVGISLFTEIFALIAVIKEYNILSTRRLPQFDRSGGDDRA